MAKVFLFVVLVFYAPTVPGCHQCMLWKPWGTCSHRCGGGIQRRIGYECCISEQICGLSCQYSGKMILQNRTCNGICKNGGTFDKDGCVCVGGYRGRCCQLGVHLLYQ
jgi:hypothetical protein